MTRMSSRPGVNRPHPALNLALLRFRLADVKMLVLVSGMLAGGSELAGKPVVVLAPVGKSNILFFANNPFWRMQTSGSYMLLFDAAMNYNNLAPKKAEPKDSKQ